MCQHSKETDKEQVHCSDIPLFLDQCCCCWCHCCCCWHFWFWRGNGLNLTLKGVSPSCLTCTWCLATWKVTTGNSGCVHLYPSHLVQDWQLKTQHHSLVMVTPLKCSLLMEASSIISLRGAEGWRNFSLAEEMTPTQPCFHFPAITENDLFKEKLLLFLHKKIFLCEN